MAVVFLTDRPLLLTNEAMDDPGLSNELAELGSIHAGESVPDSHAVVAVF